MFKLHLAICLAVLLQGGSFVRCNSTCSEGTFPCPGEEKCIPQRMNCDGNNDCFGGKDEMNCRDKWDKGSWYIDVRTHPDPNWPANRIHEKKERCDVSNFTYEKCSCRYRWIGCIYMNFQVPPPELNAYGTEISALDLGGNNFNHLRKQEFRGLPKLQSLYIDYVKLETMEDGIFSENLRLQTLFVSNNNLTALPTDWFSPESQLLQLWAGNNSLEKLDGRSFQNITMLTDLNLDHNRITKLQKSNFEHLVGLKYLSLHNNHIEALDPDTFSDLIKLKTLYLSQNRIGTIAPGSFRGLEKLKFLYLAENRLKTLSSGVFEDLRQLKGLCLNNNSIERIDSDVFEPTKSLVSLRLKGNPLRNLSNTVLEAATSLRFIYFDDVSQCSAAKRVRVCGRFISNETSSEEDD